MHKKTAYPSRVSGTFKHAISVSAVNNCNRYPKHNFLVYAYPMMSAQNKSPSRTRRDQPVHDFYDIQHTNDLLFSCLFLSGTVSFRFFFLSYRHLTTKSLVCKLYSWYKITSLYFFSRNMNCKKRGCPLWVRREPVPHRRIHYK